MPWLRWRSASVGRRGATAIATAAVAIALVATTPTPLEAGEDDERGGAVPGFLFSEDRYTSFEAPDADVEIYPSGINDRGEITGEYIRPDRESGFIRDRRGRFTTFDVPGARGTEAVKINDRGQIVGRYSQDTPFVNDSTRVRGYVRHRGKITELDVPGATHTLPTGINDRGHVIGHYVDARGTTHGFLWRDGRFTILDLVGGTSPTPVDINDRGDVVGLYLDVAGAAHGFVLRQGRYTTMSDPSASATVPSGINDRGEIVGYAADDLELTGAQGFLRAPGVTGRYSPINVPGAPRSLPLGINDGGQIVGLSERPDPTPSAAGTGERQPVMSSGLDLVTVRGITVSAGIADQLDSLLGAAEADGLALTGHGYRDTGRQIALRRVNCGTSTYAIYEMPAGNCSPPTARPGMSKHERGLAIDFRCNGGLIRSHSDPCYRWMADHAAAYGFFSLPSEPWHWSVDGT